MCPKRWTTIAYVGTSDIDFAEETNAHDVNRRANGNNDDGIMSAVQKLRVAWWSRLKNHRLQCRQQCGESERKKRPLDDDGTAARVCSSLSATQNTPYTNKRRMRARYSKSQSNGNSMNPPRSMISHQWMRHHI